MSINKVLISGNLTRDAELRNTAGGMSILSFSVAVNDRRKDNNGEWKDFPNYIDCTVFGARAESLSRILTKGMKVAIEGKLRWSQWTDNSGSKRSKIDVIVDELELMVQRQSGQTPQQQPHQRQAAPQQYQEQQSFYDEDIPF